MTGLDALERIKQIDVDVDILREITSNFENINDYKTDLLERIVEKYKKEKESLLDRLAKQCI